MSLDPDDEYRGKNSFKYLYEDINHGIGVLVRFAHLFGRVRQRHDLFARFRDHGRGYGEGVGIKLVEAVGDVAAKFHVLFLVHANGHYIRLIKQNVRRHQHGIGEKPRVDVVGVFLTFVLKLRHA